MLWFVAGLAASFLGIGLINGENASVVHVMVMPVMLQVINLFCGICHLCWH